MDTLKTKINIRMLPPKYEWIKMKYPCNLRVADGHDYQMFLIIPVLKKSCNVVREKKTSRTEIFSNRRLMAGNALKGGIPKSCIDRS